MNAELHTGKLRDLPRSLSGLFHAAAQRNPERGYVLGIECDGKAYHSEWSARARDVGCQRILENRGWKIHRIWSTNWWLDRDFELRKLAARIKSLTGH